MLNFPIDRIPPKGYLLAYFSTGILFDAYQVRDNAICCEALNRFANDEMTECHLFSREAEFRAVFSQSLGKWLTSSHTSQQEQMMDPDLIYAQQALLKQTYASRNDLPKQLIIINRYNYSANDTLVLKDYRISY